MNITTDFNIDGTKTLEMLEGPIAHYDIPTALMSRVSALSKTPLMSIDGEGLRLMLVQKMFTRSIVPATLVHLSIKPLTGGDLEEGALMRSLFQFTPMEFWKGNRDMFKKSKSLLISAKADLLSKLATEADPEEMSLLQEAKDNFGKAEKYCEEIEQDISGKF
jgi:hypothetical protein